jgi:Protein of unknown function (DUF3828)
MLGSTLGKGIRVPMLAALAILMVSASLGSNKLSEESFIRDFYVRYIGLLDQRPRLSFAEVLKRIRDSLAPGFYQEIVTEDFVDADPILDAQDWDSAWKRNIRVMSKAGQTDGKASLVCFGVNEEPRHAILVTLVESQRIRSAHSVPVARCN